MGVLLLLSSSTSATLCCDSENVMKQKCIKSISFALRSEKKKKIHKDHFCWSVRQKGGAS